MAEKMIPTPSVVRFRLRSKKPTIEMQADRNSAADKVECGDCSDPVRMAVREVAESL